MTNKPSRWIAWLPLLGLAAWGAFTKHSGIFAWLYVVGLLFLVIFAIGHFSSHEKDRFARSISLLPKEERERRLATMSPKQREHILHWIRTHVV